jgi:hypothetical protein
VLTAAKQNGRNLNKKNVSHKPESQDTGNFGELLLVHPEC